MTLSDRPFLRLFVHCHNRKFVQLARPSDSLRDLVLDIEAKYCKLYSNSELRAPKIQCADKFDLDLDDLVADVFEDRDHVYVDVSDSDDVQSSAKRACFRSPTPTPERKTMLWQTGGSPIHQKMTPVSSLPNMTDAAKNGAQKISDDRSSTDSIPMAQTSLEKPSAPSKKSAPKKASSYQAKEIPVAPKEKESLKEAVSAKPSAQRKVSAAKSNQASTKSTPSEQPKQPSSPQLEAQPEVEEPGPTANGSTAQPKKPKKTRKSKNSNVTETVPESEKNEIADDSQELPATADKDHDKIEVSSNEEMAICKKCQETMPKKSLKYHQRLHYEHFCEQCPRKFGSAGGLERHIKKDH